MRSENIYIRLLDGVVVWVSIDAIRVSENLYRIIDSKEYSDYEDALYLHEFYPEDIVEVELFVFPDSSSGLIAKKLSKAGMWPERKFKEFKFKATIGELPIDKETSCNYREVIARVRKEYDAGQFYYPSLIESVNKLSRLLKEFN